MSTIRNTTEGVEIMNVRHGNIAKVHAITPAAHSGILHRAAAPACGAYIGSPRPRVLTSDPVTCKKCLSPETYTAMFAPFGAL